MAVASPVLTLGPLGPFATLRWPVRPGSGRWPSHGGSLPSFRPLAPINRVVSAPTQPPPLPHDWAVQAGGAAFLHFPRAFRGHRVSPREAGVLLQKEPQKLTCELGCPVVPWAWIQEDPAQAHWGFTHWEGPPYSTGGTVLAGWLLSRSNKLNLLYHHCYVPETSTSKAD